MGIIKAALGAAGGALADQWLETIEPEQINNATLTSIGVKVRKNDKRSSNKRGTEDVISNGSVIHVPENTYMLLVDGGKIISATDEAGYYQVDNSRAPSLFFTSSEGKDLPGYGNTGTTTIQRPGGLKNTLNDSWERFKFGGTTPTKQTVIYINKMELPDIRFGTKAPLSYTDRVLVPGRVVPCKLTSFGTYSIKIADPILFYSEVCSKTDKSVFTTEDMAEQYINEFLMAYTTALANLSAASVLISDIPMKTMELGLYMADVLDKEWLAKRGFYIHSVGIAGIHFDEKTDELLSNYANDSILFDANARAARMTAGMAEGLRAAGSNEGGAMMGFAGMNMGMNVAGGMGAMPNQQLQGQPAYNPAANPIPAPPQPAPVSAATGGWTCTCGNTLSTDAMFCSKCGNKKPENKSWTCTCGNVNQDLFCSKCGTKKSEVATPKASKCNSCGWMPEDPVNPPAFCPKCGDRFNELDKL